jgi:hypothetical protein
VLVHLSGRLWVQQMVTPMVLPMVQQLGHSWARQKGLPTEQRWGSLWVPQTVLLTVQQSEQAWARQKGLRTEQPWGSLWVLPWVRQMAQQMVPQLEHSWVPPTELPMVQP